MTIYQSAYTRTVRGRPVRWPDARAWTAADYDLLERLCADRVPPSEMARYFSNPPVTGTAVRLALMRSGIPRSSQRGRPSKAERARLDALYAAWVAEQA